MKKIAILSVISLIILTGFWLFNSQEVNATTATGGTNAQIGGAWLGDF